MNSPDHGPKITILAAMASGAHQAGEESQLIVYLAARSLDDAGSGRVLAGDLIGVCAGVFSGRQLRRLLTSEAGQRYWELDRQYVRLRALTRILGSYPGEILQSLRARQFPLALLDTRQRRGAALLAAMLAGTDVPRSNAFISRFAGVDRQTVSRWMTDPTITSHILQRVAQWAER